MPMTEAKQPVHCLHRMEACMLDAVGTGLVQWIAGGHIGADLGIA